MFYQKLTVAATSLQLVVEPASSDNQSTQFTLTVTYGCTNYNPQLNKQSLTRAIETFINVLLSQDVILEYFIFPTPPTITESIVVYDIDESLPSPEDRLAINGSFNYQISGINIIAAAAMLFNSLFLF